MRVSIKPLGDSSVLLSFEQEIKPEINFQITALVEWIKEHQIQGIIDMIPSFCALVINYDPRVLSFDQINKQLIPLLKMEYAGESRTAKVYEIPVCYEEPFNPDLAFVASRAQLTTEEVVALHSGRDYLIYMLGFMPGFAYLGGLDERIHTPRLDSPRLLIPAGSVGIGGAQTGIYPSDSPGGWQLIGRTPLRTFDERKEEPILYNAGDYIRFVPITSKEYEEILVQVAEGSYQVTTGQVTFDAIGKEV